MPTTVIASARHRDLWVAPWLPRHVDRTELASVLRRHGLRLLPRAAEHTEFIAAEGLDHARAAELAADLQAIGLEVRVVNDTGITQSQRVGVILTMQLAVATLGPILGMAFMADTGGASLALVALGILAAINALVLMTRGGDRLEVAGVPAQADAIGELMAQIEALRTDLSDTVVDDLLSRVEGLRARGDASQRALTDLADELKALGDQDEAEQIEDVAQAVRRARLAAREVR